MADSAEIYALARSRGALIDLSARAKWRVTGADRVRYLNGQISNDVRKLEQGRAIHACVMTAKGKMSGDIFVSAEPEFLRLDAERALREPLAARLERYVISDDVALDDVTGEWALLHVLIGSGKVLPPMLTDVTQTTATRYGRPGIDLLVPRAGLTSLRQHLGEIFTLLDDELAGVLRVEAGVPRWGAELGEETLPAEAGLDRTSIDYHKGCYIGQEVVSRIKSLGHVNRRLCGFVSASSLAAGMGLRLPGEEKPVGSLTSAAWSFGLEKFAALGYLKRGVDAPLLEARLADAAPREVEVRELPLIP